MNIKDFFKPIEITKSISVSQRFKDEQNKPCLFTIKSVTQAQNEILKKQCFGANGVFDNQKYQAKLICASVIEPNLSNSELQAYYAVLGEEKLIKAMLLSGEYAYLSSEVSEICGFQEDIFKSVDYLKN